MMDALLLDLSGVLYDGDALIPGAVAAVERVQRSSLDVRFITNTSQKTRASLLAHLASLGFNLKEHQLFTAVDAARQWLRARRLRPWCLVHENIAGEFADFDQRDPNAVFIADAAEGFNYRNLNRAFQLCMAGAPLLGVGGNRYYKSGEQLMLDAGAFIRAIEFAAGVEATIVGKPSAEFFNQVMASTAASPGRTLMVGDDVFGDVAGALNAGIRACLVRTGKYRPGDENRVEGDFSLVDSVEAAVELALSGQP
jgi:HAD superfamily hydrolase (TIGR01458 family)